MSAPTSVTMTLRQVKHFKPIPGQDPTVSLSTGGEYYGDVQLPERLPHGRGVAIMNDGARYGGAWYRGHYDGSGAMVASGFDYEGEWRSGKMHGFGTIQYKEGVAGLLARGVTVLSPFEQSAAGHPLEYRGDFHMDHHRHGKGVMTYRNGDTYEGDWVKNQRTGHGTLSTDTGERYIGRWKDDVRHGEGELTYSSGAVFVGQFVNNKRVGHGKLSFLNGDVYEGNFAEDEVKGKGRMRYRNSDVYDGEWRDGMRHGIGVFTMAKKGVTVTGAFHKGLIHGEATVEHPGHATFLGRFTKGERREGTVWLVDGSVYNGEWRGDAMHGQGLMWYADGGFYAGQWSASCRTGTGNMAYPDGAEYSGEFSSDQRHGRGVLRLADGRVACGLWDNGEALTEGYIGEWDPTASEAGVLCGRGRFIFASGDVYDGLWRRNQREGLGVLVARSQQQLEAESKEREKDTAKGGRPAKPIFRQIVAAHHHAAIPDPAPAPTQPAPATPSNPVSAKAQDEQPTSSEEVPSQEQGDCPADQPEEIEKVHGRHLAAAAPEEADDGAKRGIAPIPWDDALMFYGGWANDAAHGEGTLQYPDTALYSGGFAENHRVGRGVVATKEGQIYTGEWAADRPHGQGTLFEVNKRKPIHIATPDDDDEIDGEGDDDAPENESENAEADLASSTKKKPKKKKKKSTSGALLEPLGWLASRLPFAASKGEEEAAKPDPPIVGYEPHFAAEGTFHEGQLCGRALVAFTDGRLFRGSFLAGRPLAEMPHRGNVISTSSKGRPGHRSPPPKVKSCTVCGAGYGFLKRQLDCALCGRAACASCLKEMKRSPHVAPSVVLPEPHAPGAMTPSPDDKLRSSKANIAETAVAASAAAKTRTRRKSSSVDASVAVAVANHSDTVIACEECLSCVQLGVTFGAFWEGMDDAWVEQGFPPAPDAAEGEEAPATAVSAELEAEAAAPSDAIIDDDAASAEAPPNAAELAFLGETEVQPTTADPTEAAPGAAATPPRHADPSGDGQCETPKAKASIEFEAADIQTPLPLDRRDSDDTDSTPTSPDERRQRLLMTKRMLVYKGFVASDRPHGTGSLWCGNATCFSGEFHLGAQRGFGVQCYANGEEYIGQWSSGRRHGKGVYRARTGVVFEGLWDRGEITRLLYHGEMDDSGRRHGRGIEYFDDGGSYNGQWEAGKRHGTGILRRGDGTTYSGEFAAHEQHGRGKMVAPDGEMYVGEFKDSQRHGRGLMYGAGQMSYEGTFVQGLLNGDVTVRDSSEGSQRTTIFRNGEERMDFFEQGAQVPDDQATKCKLCHTAFGLFLRRHHCRSCGNVYCHKCSSRTMQLPSHFKTEAGTGILPPQRVCMQCYIALNEGMSLSVTHYENGLVHIGRRATGAPRGRGVFAFPDGTCQEHEACEDVVTELLKTQTAAVAKQREEAGLDPTVVNSFSELARGEPPAECPIPTSYASWFDDLLAKAGATPVVGSPSQLQCSATAYAFRQLPCQDLGFDISVFEEPPTCANVDMAAEASSPIRRAAAAFIPATVPSAPPPPRITVPKPHPPQQLGRGHIHTVIEQARAAFADRLEAPGVEAQESFRMLHAPPAKPAEREKFRIQWQHWDTREVPSIAPDAEAELERKRKNRADSPPPPGSAALIGRGAALGRQTALTSMAAPGVASMHLLPLDGPLRFDLERRMHGRVFIRVRALHPLVTEHTDAAGPEPVLWEGEWHAADGHQLEEHDAPPAATA